MPRINHERIIISKNKAQTVSNKADERGSKTGMRIEAANDKSRLNGAKKPLLSKRRIIELTTMRKQELEYQMAAQNVVGKMIKEYKITNPQAKIAINKTAHELALAESRGNKRRAQIQANTLIQIIKQEKGEEVANSFARMLQWAVDLSLSKIQKETQEREDKFRRMTE